MAKYRALKPLFIGRPVAPGEEFASDEVPGRNWEPLDDAAKAAVSSRFGTLKPKPIPEPTGTVAAPAPDLGPTPGVDLDGWRALHWTKQVEKATALFGDFTVPDGRTQAQVAREMLEAEEQRRATPAAA
jgi:hypothetical protein